MLVKPLRQLLALMLAAGALPAFAQDTGPAVYAFVDVTVLPMTSDSLLPSHTVVVRGDRIASVGPSSGTTIPAEAVRIDGQGRFLVPGLAEMHGHVPDPRQSSEYLENVLFLYVANGVTTVRGMLGFPGQLDLKTRISRGEIMGPTLYLAGPSFSGGSVQSADQAEQRVRKQFSEGWDLLKIHPGVPLEAFDRIAETANELGMRFGGHVPEEVGLVHALEMGQETLDHLDGYTAYLRPDERDVSDAELVEVARLTRDHGTWVVPTMALWETLLGVADAERLSRYSELRYIPAEMAESWIVRYPRGHASGSSESEASKRVVSMRMRLLGILQDEGVGILMGSDAPQLFSVPGFSLRRELPLMLEAGMTPHEILVSGTRNVGDYFANEDRFGTIEIGGRADLLLLEGNPLLDLARLWDSAGVMVRGAWLSRKDIDERLDEIARSYR
jgi:hypothetical protein